MKAIRSAKVRRDTKRLFLKKGTCSRALFFILDREFGHPLGDEEQAAELLAGGILKQGYQCGLLWGAVLALGAEACRRWPERDRAVGLAIKASQHMMASFIDRAKSPDCFDITRCDWTDKLSIAKYAVTGKFLSCFRLADQWAPEAIRAAHEGLALAVDDLPEKPVSCASEVVGRLGGGDAERTMAAGLAGGIGLSGGGCGALAAAIWMNALDRIRKRTYRTALSDPLAEMMLKAFFAATDYEVECVKISGMRFATIAEHAAFIRGGGCDRVLQALAAAGSSR